MTIPEEASAYLLLNAGKISWMQMTADLTEYFNLEGNPELWRSRWRRLSGNMSVRRTPGGKLVHDYRKSLKAIEPIDPHRKLLALVKGLPKTVEAVSQAMNVSRNVLLAMVSDLRDAGHELQTSGGKIWLDTQSVPSESVATREHNGQTIIRILVVSDTHLCSKYQQLSVLEAAYDDAIAHGCDFAIHAGDLTDGFYQSRPGHIYEIFKLGFDEQLDYAVDKYPRRMKADGTLFRTLMISGNHDDTHMKADGANLVKAFANRRDDIDYLGDGFCKYWVTPTCDIDIMHPLDGSAYAISYSPQKICDAYMGGEKPKVLLIGHHHKGLYIPYRNIHVFEVPTCQAQSPWMKGKRLFAVVGWWILTLHLDAEGSVVRLVPEICQRYEMRKDDY
jgi:predicted phosphodiesterase